MLVEPATGKTEEECRGGDKGQDAEPLRVHEDSWNPAVELSAHATGKTKFSQRWGKKQPLGPESESRALPLDRLCNDPGKLVDIVFGGVEGAHPAHDRLLLDPHIEEVVPLNLFNGVAGDLSEDAIGLDLPHNFQFRDAADL